MLALLPCNRGARSASDIPSCPRQAASVDSDNKQTFIHFEARPCACPPPLKKKKQPKIIAHCGCSDLPANPSGLHPGRDSVFFQRGYDVNASAAPASVLPAAVCDETSPSPAEEDAAAAAAGPRAGNSRCRRLCCPRPGPSFPARWRLRSPCLLRSRGC